MRIHDSEQVNTIVVGAGPIGLLNVIGLLNKNPQQKVVMLEKYDEYKRNHTLRVDYRQLQKYLQACGDPEDPAIRELVDKTRKSQFIRISEIERILKERALALGAQIITGTGVTDFDEQVRKKYPNADLILGADGTRSVVSQQAIGKNYAFYEMNEQTKMLPDKMYFREMNGQLAYSVISPNGTEVIDKVLEGEAFKVSSPLDMRKINDMKKEILEISTTNGDTVVIENSEKREFDFVLQLRIEVKGDVESIPLPTLARLLQNYGITGDEYVGKKDDKGMTPINFQIMLTKEQFKLLEAHAKSGNPIRPFSGSDPRADIIPEEVMARLRGYLGLRLRHYTKPDEVVKLDIATISVNEAPATFAKQVHKRLDDGTGPDVVVVGDASLGLSYFKGINAAFEASAKLLDSISKPKEQRAEGLQQYRKWFEQTFAPGKVNEVAFFSRYTINALVGVFKTLQFILRSDQLMRSDIADRTLDLYRGHLAHVYKMEAKANKGEEGEILKWNHSYEHNGKNLDNVLTFRAQSTDKLFTAIGKNITDTRQPYKSSFHFLRDLLTPLRAVYQVTVGILQVALAGPLELVGAVVNMAAPGDKSRLEHLREIPGSFFARVKEGLTHILLGVNLAISTPFVAIKLLSRGILTAMNDKPLLVEINPGMKRLLKQSEDLLHEIETPELSEKETPQASSEKHYTNESSCAKLHSLCIDVHRKFQKSIVHGQKTEVANDKESELFKQCQNGGDVKDYKAYLSLFKQRSPEEVAEYKIETISSNMK